MLFIASIKGPLPVNIFVYETCFVALLQMNCSLFVSTNSLFFKEQGICTGIGIKMIKSCKIAYEAQKIAVI
jgi:hypothetical protein